jgi:penicillin-binding protein 1A
MVKAMVGGRDFNESQFNRAIQSRRQPGSAFKPIIYAAALDKATHRPDHHRFADRFQGRGPRFYLEAQELRRKILRPHSFAGSAGPVAQHCHHQNHAGHRHRLCDRLCAQTRHRIGFEPQFVPRPGLLGCFPAGARAAPIRFSPIRDIWWNRPSSPNRGPRRQHPGRDEPGARKGHRRKHGLYHDQPDGRVWSNSEPVSACARSNGPWPAKPGPPTTCMMPGLSAIRRAISPGCGSASTTSARLGEGETGARAASPIWLGFMQEVVKNEPVRIFQVPEGWCSPKSMPKPGCCPFPNRRKPFSNASRKAPSLLNIPPNRGQVTEPEQFFKQDL